MPKSAPFSDEQRAWLNGFLAGLFANADLGENSDVAAPKKIALSLSILFGSQTGTAERLARQLASAASGHGFAARVSEMNDFASIDFSKEQRLILITSTWGDGDPPDNAVAFWSFLNSTAAPRLDHLEFAVLGLGDRNYADFCGAGKKFDARLAELGGRRLQPRAECDTNYEATAKGWLDNLWKLLSRSPGDDTAPIRTEPVAAAIADKKTSGYDRNHPFPARLLVNRNLNGPGSAKETRHLEISLVDSGLSYEVGDALGVVPANCPALVKDILNALDCDGEEAVHDAADGGETSLGRALLQSYEITRIPPALLKLVAGRSGDKALHDLAASDSTEGVENFFRGRDVLDLLRGFPSAKIGVAEFIGTLRKLQPRLYSIASSPRMHPGEVHLTVAAVRYENLGRERKGVCSTFLADRCEKETALPIFIQPSHGFRLPRDTEKPIIMIGPGTGVAPFRAFLEERRALGARGRNWLFFGDQQQAHDFLYREEWEKALADKILTRLDTAFSRDQKEKLYVQHRLRENASEVWRWLEQGAHVYVCGDAKRMARDVDAALREIVRSAGGRTTDEAEEYVTKLRAEKRYQRDVY